VSVLVTGAGGAIGAAIVRQLLEAGHEVLAQDLRSEGLRALGGEGARTTAGDLGDPAYRDRLAELCRDAGIAGVVAAHGVEGAGPLHALDGERLRRVLHVNATSVAELLRALLAQLRECRGTFVAVASQAGLQAEPNLTAYCAAKFALVGWGRRLAPALLRADGVRLHLLCPGCTRTPLLIDAFERFAAADGVSLEEALARRRAEIAIGRIADVEETAAAAVYLLDGSAPAPVVLAPTGGEVLW